MGRCLLFRLTRAARSALRGLHLVVHRPDHLWCISRQHDRMKMNGDDPDACIATSIVRRRWKAFRFCVWPFTEIICQNGLMLEMQGPLPLPAAVDKDMCRSVVVVLVVF